jgi:GxxExxY protein
MDHDHLVSERVIRAAIEVHRALGPGLLEDPYLTCMCVELAHMGIPFERERRFALEYRGVKVGDYIPDLIVANMVVVEVKSVHHIEPVFTAQVITYLRITKLRVGLILNFNAPKLIDGLKRVVLTSTNPAASPAPGTEP